MLLFLLAITEVAFATYQVPEHSPAQEQTLASRNFWQLNRMLAYYENAKLNPWPDIPQEPALLKVGKKSQVVLILRERLRRSGDLTPEDDTGSKVFDEALADAVVSFQERHGLKADGSVGDDTRDELNIPPETRIKQISINLQRWANLSSKLGNRFVMVNIPDFHMYLFEDQKEVLSLRAIVGKRDLQTPELNSKITRIVFNPYWNIPTKIAKNDIAPKMLADSDYMRRLHIRAFRIEDNDASEVNSRSISWHSVAENGTYYHLRQDPGPENALGLVKFEFQNSHDIYMHDTSARDLFSNYIRDFSHGCIRLENPFALVEYLMKDNPRWDNEHIREALDTGKTSYAKVLQPIPIFITYITAWVDEQGRMNFRDDLYGLDEGIWNPTADKRYSKYDNNTDQSVYN
jgi:murein L,D-transpeptidase YcbB/YkuD